MARTNAFDATNLEGLDRLAHIEQYVTPALPTRDDLYAAAQGRIAETMPTTWMNGTGILSTSVACSTALALRRGETISNIWVNVTTVGATMQVNQLGLYGPDLVLMGSTSTSAASFLANGVTVCSLTNSVAISTPGVYYPAMVSVGSTPPTLARQTNFSGAGSYTASGANYTFWQMSGRGAGLAGTAVPASTSVAFWFGVS